MPNFGGGGGGGAQQRAGVLAFLRDNQQFQGLRHVVQANPQILQPMLQELGKQNPQLLQLINANQVVMDGVRTWGLVCADGPQSRFSCNSHSRSIARAAVARNQPSARPCACRMPLEEVLSMTKELRNNRRVLISLEMLCYSQEEFLSMINEPGGGELDPEAMAALGGLGEDMELGGEGGARASL